MKRVVAFLLLFVVFTGCTVENTTSIGSQAPSSTPEVTAEIIYIPPVLPQIEGLVLPDEKRVEQFCEGGSSADYHSDIWPTNYNIAKGKEKGLYSDESRWTEDFYIIQALYRKVFEAYLNNLLDLESYEYLFHAYEPVPVIPASGDIKNYYWYGSTLSMEYFYLRNNLCIERLDESDLAVFRTYHERGEYDVTQELTEIVERTFPDVIRVFTQEDADASPFDFDIHTMTTSYVPEGGQKNAANEAIVFEIAYIRDYNVYTAEQFSELDAYIYENVQALLQEELQKKMPECSIEIFEQYYAITGKS